MTARVRPHLDCVLLVVELLRRAVGSKIRAIGVVSESTEQSDYCYSVIELADALLRLAVNDDNKVAIRECDGLPIIVQMLQRRFGDDEYIKALHLIRHLVFIDDVRNDQHILNVKLLFELMMEQGGFYLKEIATQILWEISNYQLTIPPYVADPAEKKPPFYLVAPQNCETSEPCIKFSFQQDWKDRYRALFIRDKLVQAGYNVWINEYPVSKYQC
ncbi:uncharacterized protein [Amphiura filiformis]|uniref:uncharacterized protein n=1 Tax=Amphiura filiformis TaxID=82378 RepID=UPI003B216DB7